VDLDRLKIDRSEAAPRSRSRPGRGKLVRWGVIALVVVVIGFLLRTPLLRGYRWLTLPSVETARAVRANPLAASAVSGTAANGYVVAARRAALSADTPGRVVELNVEEGSVVKKGDIVARLYSKEYEAALQRADAELGAARAGVTRAEAVLAASRTRLESQRSNVKAAEARVNDIDLLVDLAKLDFDRETQLFESGAGTQQGMDEARTKLQRAIAQLSGEKARLTFARSRIAENEAQIVVDDAALEEAKTSVGIRQALRDEAQAILEKTEVRAPFDGVVVLKDAEVGEVVSPNSQGGSSRGSVVTMVDFRSLEAQVELPEKSLSAVAIGTRANIYLDAYPQVRYTGEIKRIWPTANRQKGTVELRIVFDKPDERLRPEMGVRVVFNPSTQPTGAGAAPAVLISEECVVRIQGQTGVFELERDVARWRAVTLGDKRSGRVVVKSGLSGGEQLVLRPPTDLTDGARVRPRP
jgi:RND family efflux transporter MFP subunit